MVGIAGIEKNVEQNGEGEGLGGRSLDGQRQTEQTREHDVTDGRNAKCGLQNDSDERKQIVDRDESLEALARPTEDHARGDKASANSGGQEHEDVRLSHACEVERPALAVRCHHRDERVAQAL